MELKVKKLGIWTAISGAIATGIYTFATPERVMWGFVVLGLGIAGMIAGVGHTEYTKRVSIIPPKGMKFNGVNMPQRIYWDTEEGKRRIMQAAVPRGFLYTFFSGVVFLPYTTSTSNQGMQTMITIGFLWTIWSAIIAFSQGRVYKWAKRHLLPLLNRKVNSMAGDVDQEGEKTNLTIMADRTIPTKPEDK